MTKAEVQREYPYIYVLFGRRGVGERTFLGTVKRESRFAIDALCKSLGEELKESFPRGIDYEMMGYDPDMLDLISEKL
jgi:hypothetical protein